MSLQKVWTWKLVRITHVYNPKSLDMEITKIDICE